MTHKMRLWTDNYDRAKMENKKGLEFRGSLGTGLYDG